MGQLTRIRKILQRARSGNAHEAASARAIASDLMRKHGISEHEVAEESFLTTNDKSDPNREELALAVAAAHDCETAVEDGIIVFRGHGDIIQRAQSLYLALVTQADAMDTMPKGYSYELPKSAFEAWRACFWIGFVAATAQRLKPKRRDAVAAEVVPERNERAQLAAEQAMKAIDIMTIDMESWLAPVDVGFIVRWLKKKAHAAGQHIGLNVPIEAPPVRIRGRLCQAPGT